MLNQGNLTYAKARLAGMIWFCAPGMAYGIFSSRLPALKEQVQAGEATLGIILLMLGLAGLVGLFSASHLISRFRTRPCLVAATVAMLTALVCSSFSPNPEFLCACFAAMGLCIGIADVCVNMQGVAIERKFGKPTMNLLHGGYNIGAFTGSGLGALFAAMSLSPTVNFICAVIPLAGLLVWSFGKLLIAEDYTASEEEGATVQTAKPRIPAVIFILGFVALIAYETEGSIGDWGSILLYDVKHAPESIAALAIGTFSACSFACRSVADRFRTAHGDYAVAVTGATLAAIGMAMTIFAPYWQVCLLGYALCGFGLGPIVPIVFSVAGNIKGIPVQKAISIISICAYGGLLTVPPLIGFLAEHYGLQTALLCILAGVFILILGVRAVKRPASGEAI